MTKEEYLSRFEQALKENGVDDVKAAVDKYSERFRLAAEAGFTVDETIAKLGEPEEAAKKFKAGIPPASEKEKKQETAADDKESGYDLSFVLVTDDIDFSYGEIEEPYVDFNEANPDDYRISKTDSSFELEFKPHASFFSHMHRSHLRIVLPSGRKIGSVRINVVSSKVNMPSLVADSFIFEAVSGSLTGVSCKVNKADFSLVSGHISLQELSAENVKFSTVSGDASIQSGQIGSFRLSSVSGTARVEQGYVSSASVTAFTGKLFVGGESRH